MKRKLLAVLLMCTLTFNFTACGNNRSAEQADSSSAETETDTNDKKDDADNEKDDAENDSQNDEKSESENDGANENNAKEDEAPSAEDETPSEEKEEAAPETVYNLGEGAPLKEWTISVTDAQIVESIAADYGSFNPSEDGNKFIHVFVAVNNDGKTADKFLPSYAMGDDVYAKVLYSDGYEFTATNLLGYSNDLHDSTINPLSSQTGEIAFEIPSTVADSAEELLIQFVSGNDSVKFKIR